MQLIVQGNDADLRAICAELNASGNVTAKLVDLDALENAVFPKLGMTQGPMPFPSDWSAKQ